MVKNITYAHNTLNLEFDSTKDFFNVLQQKKIRLTDLELKHQKDFIHNDQDENQIVQQAKFMYFMKKKKAKLQQLTDILVEKRKLKANQYINDYITAGEKTIETNKEKKIKVKNERIRNFSQDQIDLIQSQESLGSKNFQSQIQIFKTQDSLLDSPVQISPQTIKSPKKLKKLKVDKSQKLLNRKNDKSSKSFVRVPSKLNLSELIVNKMPDIPLKVEVNFKNPEMFLTKKVQNLEKMSQAMSKLDYLAENDKHKFEIKLQDRREKVMKLKEQFEIEEYERQLRIQKQRDKQQNAIKLVEKQQKNLEKIAFTDYKMYMEERKKLQDDKERQERSLIRIKAQEIEQQKRRDQEREHYKQQLRKIEQEEAEMMLQQIDQKLGVGNQNYQQHINDIKKSRNQYNNQHQRMHTAIIDRLNVQEIKTQQNQQKRQAEIWDKTQRVEENRKYFQEQVIKMNTERMDLKQKRLRQIEKQTDQWSHSILQKHQRQWDQVMKRYQSNEDQARANKEVNILRFQDQNLNLSDIQAEKQRKQHQILQKHMNLHSTLDNKKKQYEDLQMNQRLMEMQKKKELFT
eukprot:403346291